MIISIEMEEIDAVILEKALRYYASLANLLSVDHAIELANIIENEIATYRKIEANEEKRRNESL